MLLELPLLFAGFAGLQGAASLSVTRGTRVAFGARAKLAPSTSLSMQQHGEAMSSTTSTAVAAASLAASIVMLPLGPAIAASGVDIAATSASGITYRLPPIKESPNRCSFVSSAMGQANGARDSLQDFRTCDMSGKSASEYDLSGAVGSDANFKGVNFKEAQLSKCFFRNSIFDGADFSNAIVDRVDFEGASLKGTIFNNAVLTSTSFRDADLRDTDFSEAYLGDFDQKKLCRNPTLQGENPTTKVDTRASAGCGG